MNEKEPEQKLNWGALVDSVESIVNSGNVAKAAMVYPLLTAACSLLAPLVVALPVLAAGASAISALPKKSSD